MRSCAALLLAAVLAGCGYCGEIEARVSEDTVFVDSSEEIRFTDTSWGASGIHSRRIELDGSDERALDDSERDPTPSEELRPRTWQGNTLEAARDADRWVLDIVPPQEDAPRWRLLTLTGGWCVFHHGVEHPISDYFFTRDGRQVVFGFDGEIWVVEVATRKVGWLAEGWGARQGPSQ